MDASSKWTLDACTIAAGLSLLAAVAGPQSVVNAADALPARLVTMHWQQVPLGDAARRLQESFDEIVFLDRRLDPSREVSLEIAAASVQEAAAALADAIGAGHARLNGFTYLGPRRSAAQLPVVAAERRRDMARLPMSQRAALQRSRRLAWPRLTEPRGLIVSLVERHGWRLAEAEQIPHDLWAAGALPELPLADQLSVLLAGFDLTFEVRQRQRELAIVPIEEVATVSPAGARRPPIAPRRPGETRGGARQMYTLRVERQRVGAVLDELARRLDWPIDVDQAAIRAAGAPLDSRVSFAVEEVGQDELLEALLQPAGLDFRREGQRIRIVPRQADR